MLLDPSISAYCPRRMSRLQLSGRIVARFRARCVCKKHGNAEKVPTAAELPVCRCSRRRPNTMGGRLCSPVVVGKKSRDSWRLAVVSSLLRRMLETVQGSGLMSSSKHPEPQGVQTTPRRADRKIFHRNSPPAKACGLVQYAGECW